MKASKTLRRPANWQDFETLCKQLWGEIWQCPEIKKNGRAGQLQNGVDIYGVPKGENQYYGIQCKGKDEYTQKQFTKQELISEIENAKTFSPGLKKLYFATTALKDVGIEAFVRRKNVEHLQSGLFEIHIFCWEDIVELIDANRHTHDWYLKNENFKNTKEIKVTFHNDEVEMHTTTFFMGIIPGQNQFGFLNRRSSDRFASLGMVSAFERNMEPAREIYVNCSYFSFQIKINNTGASPIESYNIRLEFEGKITDIAETNETGHIVIPSIHTITELDHHNKRVRISPQNMLVAGDSFEPDILYARPVCGESKVIIKWRLLGKDFNESGELSILIENKIVPIYVSDMMDDPDLIVNRDGDMMDCVLPKSYFENE